MKIGGRHYRSIWWDAADPDAVKVINQEKLPFIFEIRELRSVKEIYDSICNMTLRGAPVIGAAGAFGIYLATLALKEETGKERYLADAARLLISSRPTAINLSWAINKVMQKVSGLKSIEETRKCALESALEICEEELANCLSIGRHGIGIIEELSRKKGGKPVNILTHCNAGWLACIDHGTATAPIYLARDMGIAVHVWVDETRPRNQGAKLTAFELAEENIPHTLIADNTGGHLMQHGMVDLVITGSDRTAVSGDTANKTGTYLKALGARDNGIPFYVALPSSSIDFSVHDGIMEIPVEERSPGEVTNITGFDGEKIISVRLCPDKTKAVNFGFDITPARLITGLITERGICGANETEINKLFSDKLTLDYGRCS